MQEELTLHDEEREIMECPAHNEEPSKGVVFDNSGYATRLIDNFGGTDC